MEIIEPGITFPEVKLEYIIEEGEKKFRVICNYVDPILIHLLKSKEIRMQIWIERELKKRCGKKSKRSWVHSIDNTLTAPPKLFTGSQYNYGGGLGWGWKTQDIIPPYSTTNGYAPSEFEITAEDFLGKRIIKRINVLDIFSNNIRNRCTGTSATTGDEMEYLTILGRNKSTSQPLRVRLVINHEGKVHMSEPSNPIILGIHKDKDVETFDGNVIRQYVKVSYCK